MTILHYPRVVMVATKYNGGDDLLTSLFLGRPGMPLVYPYYCVSRKAGDKLIEIDR